LFGDHHVVDVPDVGGLDGDGAESCVRDKCAQGGVPGDGVLDVVAGDAGTAGAGQGDVAGHGVIEAR
jgi:hypothetical protein